MYDRILFTHDDLDGAGCRILFNLAYHNLNYGKDYKIVNCSNSDVDLQVEREAATGNITPRTMVFFGDICGSRETLRMLQDKFHCMVIILDHHRTNFFAEHEITAPSECHIVPENELGVMQSGTSLMYQWLCRHLPETHPFNGDRRFYMALELLVDTIRSYDTYEWKDIKPNPLAKRLNILFFMLGMEYFCQMYLEIYGAVYEGRFMTGEPLIPPTADIFIDAKLQNEQRIIDEFTLNDVVIAKVRGHKCALLMKTTGGANFSELGNQFLKRYPDLDFIAQFTLADGGTWSFRTVREDLDLGADIAKPLGGGGHPKAAGAPFSGNLKESLTNIAIAYLDGAEISGIQYYQDPDLHPWNPAESENKEEN